ncbi:MAG: isoprenylcysteine carboxylmethyltransferase family protein [Burkholderiales bacterium]|nr:isoprenylcysteine carboxylmethyltransferase family protein [Burkholderiales bacterium]
MKRLALFVYGLLSYAVFFATFLYAIGFIGGFLVPTTLDGVPHLPFWRALLIDLGLLTVFAVQHSVMARPAFKRWWTHIVPEPIERSTYVLFSSLTLLLLFALWQPMGGVIWNVEDMAGRVVFYALYVFGWLLVLATTFMINHFDLFGLRQVWMQLRGRPYTHLRFVTPGPYRLVRHPLYVGWLFAFWATPTMTLAHLVFALATTAYILIAIRFEEHDLVDMHGDDYRLYRSRVPMLIPRLFGRARDRAAV